jgi:2,4-dienoyl-CoA reductase-like NADH-dependent reductase (Old Yellow Enzyme family)
MANYDVLFQPLTIKNVTIRNRFLSTSHQPGYAVGGKSTERYVRYEAEKAKGGVGLVQFGGATTVSVENTYYYGLLNGSVDSVVPQLRQMAAAIHEHGAVCTVQLSHGGRRERWDIDNWLPVFAPSRRRELMHRAFPAELEDHDVQRACRNYAAAARRVREGDVDGVEISCIPPGMIGQFWSPLTNVRSDGYGGSLANRMRFGLEVLEAARREVGDDYLMGMRLSADEMKQGGLTNEDCVEIAAAYAESGLVDFVSVVGGQSSDYKSTHEMYPTMQIPTAPYLDMAAAVKARVNLPVFHATRITDAATAAHAVGNGLIDMVGMTRAFIADPHHVNKLREGREADIRPCVGATYCIDRITMGGEALCMHNVVTGREDVLAHEIAQSEGPARRVVVVGGGPGGLEAARVAALRGHSVVMFEAAAALGGQLALAAKATWRRELSGVVNWLAGQVEKLGVEVRLNQFADANQVLAGGTRDYRLGPARRSNRARRGGAGIRRGGQSRRAIVRGVPRREGQQGRNCQPRPGPRPRSRAGEPGGPHERALPRECEVHSRQAAHGRARLGQQAYCRAGEHLSRPGRRTCRRPGRGRLRHRTQRRSLSGAEARLP